MSVTRPVFVERGTVISVAYARDVRQKRVEPNVDRELGIEWNFFFSSRRRHTSLTCDWSSDVCSSDLRYGDVRGTDTGALSAVVDALTVRVCAGLPAAAGGLADDAASALRASLDGMHAALGLHAHGELGAQARDRWLTALSALDGRRDVHGLVAGRVVRLLADGGSLSPQEAAGRFTAALSVGVQAADKAQWAEGFLSGSGLLLAHDRDLLTVLDGWVASLSAQEFLDALPLLRRTFGEFAQPERTSIGRAVRHLSGDGSHRRGVVSAHSGRGDGAGDADELDAERAAGALRTVAM